MSDSTNLQLPYLEAAQAQKHVTVNESLRKLDALVFLSVEDKDLTAPPGSPTDGARYIPKATATGAWSGKENYVAHYVDGAWEFYTPREGWQAYVKDEDVVYCYSGSAWVSILTAGLDADLQAIAALAPSNDDVVQRKSGAWTNRTAAQLLADMLAAFAQNTQGQLAFPATQNPSAGANTLDDYEEGTFTPSISFGGGTTGIAYTTQVGYYLKIGKLVFVNIDIVLSSKGSSTGQLAICGLPFTADGSTRNYTNADLYLDSVSSAVGSFMPQVERNSTYAQIWFLNAAPAAGVSNTHINNNSEIGLTAVYQAAS